MTVTIQLPTVLRRLADDEKNIVVEAKNVGEAVQALTQRHPALGQQLLDENGAIRPFVKVFVDKDEAGALDGALTPVRDGQSLRIVPAIAGGCAK